MHSQSHTHTHTNTHALTHARTYAARTHTHKHTHARTHAHTHIHTHTEAHRCAVGGSRQAELPDVRIVPATGLPFPDCTLHSSVTHLEPCWHQRVPPARCLGQKKGVTHLELCRHQAVQPARRGVEQSRDDITHLELFRQYSLPAVVYSRAVTTSLTWNCAGIRQYSLPAVVYSRAVTAAGGSGTRRAALRPCRTARARGWSMACWSKGWQQDRSRKVDRTEMGTDLMRVGSERNRQRLLSS